MLRAVDMVDKSGARKVGELFHVFEHPKVSISNELLSPDISIEEILANFIFPLWHT